MACTDNITGNLPRYADTGQKRGTAALHHPPLRSKKQSEMKFLLVFLFSCCSGMHCTLNRRPPTNIPRFYLSSGRRGRRKNVGRADSRYYRPRQSIWVSPHAFIHSAVQLSESNEAFRWITGFLAFSCAMTLCRSHGLPKKRTLQTCLPMPHPHYERFSTTSTTRLGPASCSAATMPSCAPAAQQKSPFISIPPWTLRHAASAETPESPIAAAEIYLSWNLKSSMKREKRNRRRRWNHKEKEEQQG